MAGVIIALVLEQYAEVHEVYSRYQENAAQDRREAANKIARACVGMEPPAFTRCISSRVATYYHQQATNQDLKAQQDMAFWAFWMFAASCSTVVIAAIGIYYIRDTLIATRQTIAEAEKASAAANETVEVTRDIGQRQLRAYIASEGGRILKFGEDEPIVAVAIKNYGQTPAYDLIGWIAVRYTESDLTEFPPPGPEDRRSFGILAPSSFYESVMTLDTPRPSLEHKKRLMRGDATLYVYGRVEYKDVFDEDRYFNFRFQFGGKSFISPEFKLAQCDEGNDGN